MGYERALLLLCWLTSVQAAVPYTPDPAGTYTVDAAVSLDPLLGVARAKYTCTFDVNKSMRRKHAWIGVSFSGNIDQLQYKNNELYVKFADPNKMFYLFSNLGKVKRVKKYRVQYWAIFKGPQPPTSSCTMHMKNKYQNPKPTRPPPPTTVVPPQSNVTTSIPGADFPYSAPLTVSNPWVSSGEPVVDVSCTLVTDRAYLPDTIQILVTLSKPTKLRNAWTGNRKDSDADGRWYLFTNKYHAQQGQFQFGLQLSYEYGTPPPTGECKSTVSSSVGIPMVPSGNPPVTTVAGTGPGDNLPFETPMLTVPKTMLGVQLLDSKCTFKVNTSYPSNSVYVKVILTTETKSVEPFNGILKDQASDGTWYLFTNSAPLTQGVLTFSFQLTYTGNVQPTGVCRSSLEKHTGIFPGDRGNFLPPGAAG